MNLVEFMNNIADFYDEICTPCSNERTTFLHNYIVNNLNECSVVLDEACSTGETLLNIHLSDRYKLIGMDLSEGMIKKCLQKSDDGKIDFIVDDMRFLNHLNCKVDLIYNNSIVWLSDIDEIEQTFRRAHDVLNREGLLIIDTNNSETFLKGQKKLCSSCVISDEYEIYKTTLFHDLENGYSATQIYTKYSYREDIVNSYASRLNWRICDKSCICNILKKTGFELIKMLGDYKAEDIDNAAYIQFICKKQNY